MLTNARVSLLNHVVVARALIQRNKLLCINLLNSPASTLQELQQRNSTEATDLLGTPILTPLLTALDDLPRSDAALALFQSHSHADTLSSYIVNEYISAHVQRLVAIASHVSTRPELPFLQHVPTVPSNDGVNRHSHHANHQQCVSSF